MDGFQEIKQRYERMVRVSAVGSDGQSDARLQCALQGLASPHGTPRRSPQGLASPCSLSPSRSEHSSRSRTPTGPGTNPRAAEPAPGVVIQRVDHHVHHGDAERLRSNNTVVIARCLTPVLCVDCLLYTSPSPRDS
eukprot:TRINITY_DN26486_c0_g1_i1.p1 TRINITY_DN26486_c0_g1~~TRINITY_DN26486_c0_g1_i1.p1  ORF type:complete len:136 (-),score=13.09 TRINITY_DN26486_c0_g1_i1:110-517(-)